MENAHEHCKMVVTPPPPTPPWDGRSHVKGVGMLVVYFCRSVNYGFWFHLGFSGGNANICSHQGIIILGLHVNKLKNVIMLCCCSAPIRLLTIIQQSHYWASITTSSMSAVYNLSTNFNNSAKTRGRLHCLLTFYFCIISSEYAKASVVTAYVYHGVHRRLLGQHSFEFLSRNDTFYRLLYGALGPVKFMCESLQLTPAEVHSLDSALAETFRTNAPEGFNLLGIHKHVAGKIN